MSEADGKRDGPRAGKNRSSEKNSKVIKVNNRNK